MNKKKISAEEMELINGGMVLAGGPSSSRRQQMEQKSREALAQMQLKLEQTADIRMRASEDALKAAMRIDRQEADIKEAIKAQRIALGF